MMMSDYHRGSSSIPQATISGFSQEPNQNPNPNPDSNPAKRKRNLPGTPDPDSEVIALSPKSLMATNRFICDVCNKGFQRDQNLQLHRRGHNLPWKLKQRTGKEVKKKVYICPEKSCIHHHPSRALGDLTGVKKHYSRKHGEKKWKCEKCSKKYAVQSDWKAHSKICGTREYKCDCGTIFARKDSFITHRAFCDALAEESARFTSVPRPTSNLNFRTDQLVSGTTISNLQAGGNPHFPAVLRPDLVGLGSGQLNMDEQKPRLPMWLDHGNSHLNPITGMAGNSNNDYLGGSSSVGFPDLIQTTETNMFGLSAAHIQWLNRGQEVPFSGDNLSSLALPRVLKEEEDQNEGNLSKSLTTLYYNNNNQNLQGAPIEAAHMSATALLQKAAQMGSTRNSSDQLLKNSFGPIMSSFDSFNRSRNEVHKLMSVQPNQSAMNLNEIMNNISASSTPASTGGGDWLLMGDDMMNSSISLMADTRNMDTPLMMAQISGNLASYGEAERSKTRDFLGVGRGGDHGARPLLQQGLSKFDSLSSARPQVSKF